MNEILLYGDINEYLASDVVWQIKKAEEAAKLAEGKLKPIKLRVNSAGGQVVHAFSIVSAILNSSLKIHAHIEGLAASCASWVALSCDKVYATDYSLIMWHEAQAPKENLTDQKVLDALEAHNISIATIYNRRTGKTVEEIRGLMKKQTWWVGSEAKKDGLIDELVETEARLVQNITDLLARANGPDTIINEACKIYNSFSQNNNPKPMLKEILNALGMDESSDAVGAIKNLVQEAGQLKAENKALKATSEALTAENDTLKAATEKYENEAKQALEARADEIINAGVKARKFAQAEATEWRGLYLANPATVENLIKNLPANPTLAGYVEKADKPADVPAWKPADMSEALKSIANKANS